MNQAPSSLLLIVPSLPAIDYHTSHVTFFPDLLEAGDDPKDLRARLRHGLDPEEGLGFDDSEVGARRNDRELSDYFTRVQIRVENFRRPEQLKAILTAANDFFPSARTLFLSMDSGESLFTEKTAQAIEMFTQAQDIRIQVDT
ncbi:hypothetical protein BKA70DRAFT_1436020 [Coprinopsis sp. MPI-PUGE-AT-0042]|nr:hypothetical protein BKA70DRAFT_1436020 [Coprinopsis sp. MPI-PUGE-AT-0042]